MNGRLLWKNISFNLPGEYFPERDRKLTEVSIPVWVDENGYCRYPKAFILWERGIPYASLAAIGYHMIPFRSDPNTFTETPYYHVPKLFEEVLRNIDKEGMPDFIPEKDYLEAKEER